MPSSEAARTLQMTRHSVIRQIKERGTLPGRQLSSGTWVVKRDDVARLREARVLLGLIPAQANGHLNGNGAHELCATVN
jgi:hypothetical protein